MLLAALAACLLWSGAARAVDEDTAGATEPLEPLRLVVSLSEQRVDVYRGNAVIDSAPVSTGMKGYSTPAGVYSILEKRKWHRSNLYSAAPMPFMQRLTWSGIALHAGRLPGYPASHGCIRLPEEFARKLFGETSIGVDVVITQRAGALAPIDDPALFQPSDSGLLTASAENTPATASDTPAITWVGLASAGPPPLVEETSDSPLRILITRRRGRERMFDIQRLLFELGHDPGRIDGWLGPDTARAIKAFQTAAGLPPTGATSDELITALYEAVDREPLQGHLYVRQDYEPLFDAPVVLKNPEAPLGTHFYAAGFFGADATQISWQAVTIGGDSGITPAGALKRVEIPDHLRDRISAALTPGSTLIVSDEGVGRETGKGTDFIVQVR